MKELIDKAEVLIEALPYIQRFQDRTVVIKYGGNAMVSDELRSSFALDVVLLKTVGLRPVIVHGGGPQIGNTLGRLGIETRFVDGLRVTDDATMEVVEMVLGGKVNQQIVSLICGHGGRAVGLTGKDDGFLQATKVARMTTRSGKEIDPGRVGEVRAVRVDVITKLVEGGFIPVISPVAVDAEGAPLNVNADTVAGAVAGALRAEKLVLMTDIEGIRGRGGDVESSLTAPQIEELIGEGVIEGGMIPKVRCGLDALTDGVSKVHVIDGRRRHACLLEIFTDQGIGTQILP